MPCACHAKPQSGRTFREYTKGASGRRFAAPDCTALPRGSLMPWYTARADGRKPAVGGLCAPRRPWYTGLLWEQLCTVVTLAGHGEYSSTGRDPRAAAGHSALGEPSYTEMTRRYGMLCMPRHAKAPRVPTQGAKGCRAWHPRAEPVPLLSRADPRPQGFGSALREPTLPS